MRTPSTLSQPRDTERSSQASRPACSHGRLGTSLGGNGTFGPAVASTVIVLPVDQIPLTEQGKPNRPEIRRLGRELAARDR